MRQFPKIRTTISIVISAVLLYLVVAYCVKHWMPTDAVGWILWVASVALGFTATFRIANLSKDLEAHDDDKNNE